MPVATRRQMDVNDRSENPTMTDLRNRFASGYEVDARLVASEIVRKARLLRWARQELVTAAGRTPGRPLRDP